MSRSDLREKLEALADEMDATTYRTGMDMLTDPPPGRIREWADRIRNLLASHEEREGEDGGLLPCPFCGSEDLWLHEPDFGGDEYQIGCNDCSGGEAGAVLMNGEEFDQARARWNRRLRPHTDREPEPRWYVILDEDGDVLWGPQADRELMEQTAADEKADGTTATLHPVYIGPPIQPEEEG